jgi:hypothetical protein
METYKVDFELIANLANNFDWVGLSNYLDNCVDAHSVVKIARDTGTMSIEQIKEYAHWKLATALWGD